MLQQINIVNFALIENLIISFERGFNILTGETGAGKSILIDAINYVLGGKFNKELIRTGENRTYVEAIFTIENTKTKDVLKKLDIEHDDMVIISRETFQSGKSIAKVNGKALILLQIKMLSQTLLDIHGQHENQNLLDSTTHIQYLDAFGESKYGGKLLEYSKNYQDLTEVKARILEIEGKDGERDKIIDFLKYQLAEINNASLKEKEDEELEEKFKIVSNSEKINKVLNNAYETLHNGNDEIPSISDTITSIIKEIRGIEKHLDSIKKVGDSLEEAFYNIEEDIEQIRDLKEKIYYDESELQFINQRMYQINNLKKKYGSSIEEILIYRDNIMNQFEELSNSEEILAQLNEKKEKIQKMLYSTAEIIHEQREEQAKTLEKLVKNELNFVGLEKSIIEIQVVKEDNLGSNGFDKVQFCISTNPGEPVKPLEKIVSGGELSRIMLALKTVFVDKDETPSVIFDEIDTGISGRIAQCVGEKMYSISLKHQVFCVTHLPQIAAMSDMHFLISKNVKNNKTFTEVNLISPIEKQMEVARMIGGSEVTKLTLENSKELIKMATEKKYEIIKHNQ